MALKARLGYQMDQGFGIMLSKLGSPQPCVTRLVLGDLGCCLAGRDVGWTLGNTLSFKGLVLKLRAAEVYLMYHGSHFFHIIYKNMYTSMCIHISCIDVPVVYHISVSNSGPRKSGWLRLRYQTQRSWKGPHCRVSL